MRLIRICVNLWICLISYERPESVSCPMIVCICHRVSDRDIARQAQAGEGFRDIQRSLGVATCCGRCADCARELVQQCQTPSGAQTNPVRA